MNHRKIAEIAHVSTSTVSKALAGSKEISDDVAESIRKIALEIGYFSERNKRKSGYKRKNHVNISIICPEIISVHYSSIVTTVKSFIEERGGRVAIYLNDFSDEKTAELVEYLSMNKETDGIVLTSTSYNKSGLSIPVVGFASVDNDNVNYSHVKGNIHKVLEDIVYNLLCLGHKRIGFVGEKYTKSKQVAFVEALEKFNLDVEEKYIYYIEQRFEDIGKEAAKMIISSEGRPTAIVTAYDEIAISLIYELEASGIRVPEDISVFGMNNIPSSPYSKESLSTVKFFYDEQAALAVDILYDSIFGECTEIQSLTVNHEIIIRDSVCKV